MYAVRFLKMKATLNTVKKGIYSPKGVSEFQYPKKDQYPYRVKVSFGNITAIYKYESGLPTMGCSTMGGDKNEDNNKINRNNPTNDCFLSTITSREDNK